MLVFLLMTSSTHCLACVLWGEAIQNIFLNCHYWNVIVQLANITFIVMLANQCLGWLALGWVMERSSYLVRARPVVFLDSWPTLLNILSHFAKSWLCILPVCTHWGFLTGQDKSAYNVILGLTVIYTDCYFSNRKLGSKGACVLSK